MLWTIIVLLVVLWALGMIGGYAAGGLLHLLLAVAVIIFLVNVLTGRRAAV